MQQPGRMNGDVNAANITQLSDLQAIAEDLTTEQQHRETRYSTYLGISARSNAAVSGLSMRYNAAN
jgi:hypothetical protein